MFLYISVIFVDYTLTLILYPAVAALVKPVSQVHIDLYPAVAALVKPVSQVYIDLYPALAALVKPVSNYFCALLTYRNTACKKL